VLFTEINIDRVDGGVAGNVGCIELDDDDGDEYIY
jgi:hypothetical protein